MTIDHDSAESGTAYVDGFDLPNVDESTKAVVRMTRNGYSHDFELTYEEENALATTDDVPADLERLIMVIEAPDSSRMVVDGYSSVETHFEVLSYEHNGQLIYP